MQVAQLKRVLKIKGVIALAYIAILNNHVEIVKADILFMIKDLDNNQELDSVQFIPSTNTILMN